MKKTLLSLSSIAAVAAIVAVGSTGAWWTDTAESSNTSFNSGNMNLQLANEDSSEWQDDQVNQTWDYNNMAPGGEPMGDHLRIRNNGSTPADWLKITASTNPTDKDTNMDKHMRLTEFSYAGESLLEGGAGAKGGADLSGYEIPQESECDIDVNFGDNDYNKISDAVDNANTGDMICVEKGNYDHQYGESFPITIDKEGVTLASMRKPDGSPYATINLGESYYGPAIKVTANDVTVTGFKVTGALYKSGKSGQGIVVAGEEDDRLSGVTLSYLDVVNNDDRGVVVDYSDSVTINHVISHDNFGRKTDEEGTPGSADGIVLWHVDSSVVKNVTAYNNSDNGVYFNGNDNTGTNILAYNNGDEGVDVSLDYGEKGPVSLDKITSYGNVASAIEVEDNEEKVSITSAKLYESPEGLLISDNGNNAESDDVNIIISNSDILSSNDVGIKNQGGAAVNATNNWWGQVDGPTEEQVEGSVNTSNYLSAPHKGFINGEDSNENGFADLNDLAKITNSEEVLIEDPQLETNGGNEQDLNLEVQLDGPTAENNDMNSEVGLDVNIEMGQGPANQ